MSFPRRRAAAALAAGAFWVATGIAQAATSGAGEAVRTHAQQATDTILTLVGMGLLLWIVGNIITKQTYSTRGPKGEKLPPAQ